MYDPKSTADRSNLIPGRSNHTPLRSKVRSSSRSAVGHAAKSAARSAWMQNGMERLEERRLLTRLFPGEAAEFFQIGDVPVRVINTGAQIVDLVGASLDTSGNPRINDIPATIFDAGTGAVQRDILGGYKGLDGIEPISVVGGGPDSRTDVTDTIGPGGNFAAPSQNITVTALATNDRGITYGLNRGSQQIGDTTINYLQLMTFNRTNGNATVVARLENAVLAELLPRANGDPLEPADIIAVEDADFQPGNNNFLYFVITIDQPRLNEDATSADDLIQDTEVPMLMRIDLRDNSVTAIGDFSGSPNSQQRTSEFQEMAILPTGEIFWLGTMTTDNGLPGDDLAYISATGMFFSDISTGTSDFFGRRDIRLGGQPITSLVSFDFVPNADSGDALYAVQGQGPQTRLLRISVSDLAAADYGPLSDPDDSDNRILGESLRTISYNPAQRDTLFRTGNPRGMLIGMDTNADELAYIDLRQRFSTTALFAVYANGTDASQSLIITPMTEGLDEEAAFFDRLPAPFTGEAPAFNFGQSNFVPETDTGTAFVGLVRSGQFVNGISRDTLAGDPLDATLPAIVRPGIYTDGPLDKLFVAGTVTGAVSVNGSLGTFYAGNVFAGNAVTVDNFSVQGDLQNLLVKGWMGASPNLPIGQSSGLDVTVLGRVHQMKVGSLFRGQIDVLGQTDNRIDGVLGEIETVFDPEDVDAGAGFYEGRLYNGTDSFFRNDDNYLVDGDPDDTAQSIPQILAPMYDGEIDRGGSVRVAGSLNAFIGDNLDHYAVPLLAGQTVEFQLQTTGVVPVAYGIYDPEGRLISYDSPAFNNSAFFNSAYRFTAERPGLYRVVAQTLGFGPTSYLLSVRRGGDVSLGGLVSGGTQTQEATSVNRIELTGDALLVRSGDLGAILADGLITTTGDDITVPRGNLRVIQGAQIGGVVNNISTRPGLAVTAGTVGLLSVRATANNPISEEDSRILAINLLHLDSEGPDLSLAARDYQVVENYSGSINAVLTANRGIGVIRGVGVGTTSYFSPGYYTINADREGDDGYIDLIDAFGVGRLSRTSATPVQVQGVIGAAVGNPATGGPSIVTGPGSNVRYFRAGGSVYRDPFFGGGVLPALESAGRSLEVTDDSGTRILFTPLATPQLVNGTGSAGGGSSQPPNPFGDDGAIPNPFGGIGQLPNPQETITGRIGVLAYPVRSGGRIVLEATSSRGMRIEATGSSRATAEIGRITTSGSGVPLNFQSRSGFDATSSPFGDSNAGGISLGSGRDLSLVFSGRPISVFEVSARDGWTTGASPTNMGRFYRINNPTGDIVNMNIESVFDLKVNRLGSTASNSGAVVEGYDLAEDALVTSLLQIVTAVDGEATVLSRVAFPYANAVAERLEGVVFTGADADSYPFNRQKNMVFIGDAFNVESNAGIGNTVIDRVESVRTNADGSNARGVLDGVNAPLVFGTYVTNIDIGEGVAFSGTGNVSFSGVYTSASPTPDQLNRGILNKITGTDANIYGDILIGSGGSLNRLQLRNGSLINSDLYEAPWNVVTGGTIFPVGLDTTSTTFTSDLNTPDDEVNAESGIFVATLPVFRRVEILGDGGILSSEFSSTGMGDVTVGRDGFGILGSSFRGEGQIRMGKHEAGGYGIRGTSFDGGNQIDSIVATSPSGKLRPVTDFGRSLRQSETRTFDAQLGFEVSPAGDLHRFLGTSADAPNISGITNEGIIEDVTVVGSSRIGKLGAWTIRGSGDNYRSPNFPMRMSVGEQIGTIDVSGSIDGLNLTAGRIDRISSAGNINKLSVVSTGRIKEIKAGGTILGRTYIDSTNGRSAQISSISAGKSLYGTYISSRTIGTVFAGRDLGAESIRSFGDIGSIRVGRNVLPGTNIRATGAIDNLIVGNNVRGETTIRALTIRAQTIGGAIFGQIIIDQA